MSPLLLRPCGAVLDLRRLHEPELDVGSGRLPCVRRGVVDSTRGGAGRGRGDSPGQPL